MEGRVEKRGVQQSMVVEEEQDHFYPVFATLNEPKECAAFKCSKGSIQIAKDEWACFNLKAEERYHRECFRCAHCASKELYAATERWGIKRLNPVYLTKTGARPLHFCSPGCRKAGEPKKCDKPGCALGLIELPTSSVKLLLNNGQKLRFHPGCFKCVKCGSDDTGLRQFVERVGIVCCTPLPDPPRFEGSLNDLAEYAEGGFCRIRTAKRKNNKVVALRALKARPSQDEQEKYRRELRIWWFLTNADERVKGTGDNIKGTNSSKNSKKRQTTSDDEETDKDDRKGENGSGNEGEHMEKKDARMKKAKDAAADPPRYNRKGEYILRLYGIYEDKELRLCAVIPFMEEGALRKYVKKPIPTLDRLKLLKHAASALEWLHGHHVFHGDIRGDNFLVTDDGNRVLLADFGLSKFKEQDTSADTKRLGTRPFKAPEILSGDGRRTAQSDIYAFGIMIAEILYDRDLLEEWKELNTENFPQLVYDPKEVDGELKLCRPPRPNLGGLINEAWDAAVASWAHLPEKRGLLSNVIKLLDMNISRLEPVQPVFTHNTADVDMGEV